MIGNAAVNDKCVMQMAQRSAPVAVKRIQQVLPRQVEMTTTKRVRIELDNVQNIGVLHSSLHYCPLYVVLMHLNCAS